MRDIDGLVKRLLAGPWERHTDTGRAADDAPKEAAAAILELQAADEAFSGILLRSMDQVKTLHRAEVAEAEVARLGAALANMRARAASTRGEQACRELPKFIVNAVRQALTRSA